MVRGIPLVTMFLMSSKIRHMGVAGWTQVAAVRFLVLVFIDVRLQVIPVHVALATDMTVVAKLTEVSADVLFVITNRGKATLTEGTYVWGTAFRYRQRRWRMVTMVTCTNAVSLETVQGWC